MLHYAVIFFVIAIIAAVLGFSGIAGAASNVAWISLLNALELHLMLAAQTPGTLSDFGKELFRRTQGHIGSLTNLLDRAAYLAIKTGTEQITASILEEVVVDNAAQRLTTPKR